MQKLHEGPGLTHQHYPLWRDWEDSHLGSGVRCKLYFALCLSPLGLLLSYEFCFSSASVIIGRSFYGPMKT